MKLKKNVIFSNNEKGISKRTNLLDSNNKPENDKSNLKGDGIKSIFNFGKANDPNEELLKKGKCLIYNYICTFRIKILEKRSK